MDSFHTLLDSIKSDCAWETIPYDKVSVLAKLCGPEEVNALIGELDRLDDADLEDDPGDGIDEYWRLRKSLSLALAEVGEPAVDSLLNALHSANPQTRAYSAWALGRIGTPRAFEPLVALLAEEHEDVIEVFLIQALGDLGDPRAVAVLLPYLKPARELNRWWIVAVTADALGKLGTASVIPHLAEVLSSDPDWSARLGAAKGLRRIKLPQAAEALRRALHDEDARVRAEAEAAFREWAGAVS
jgi:HEAT repeat protein